MICFSFHEFFALLSVLSYITVLSHITTYITHCVNRQLTMDLFEQSHADFYFLLPSNFAPFRNCFLAAIIKVVQQQVEINNSINSASVEQQVQGNLLLQPLGATLAPSPLLIDLVSSFN